MTDDDATVVAELLEELSTILKAKNLLLVHASNLAAGAKVLRRRTQSYAGKSFKDLTPTNNRRNVELMKQLRSKLQRWLAVEEFSLIEDLANLKGQPGPSLICKKQDWNARGILLI